MSVSVGGLHACGVLKTGEVECWGDNTFGQAAPPAGRFASVSAGAWHTCGLRPGGNARCWGKADEGQTRVPGYETFAALSAGGSRTRAAC